MPTNWRRFFLSSNLFLYIFFVQQWFTTYTWSDLIKKIINKQNVCLKSWSDEFHNDKTLEQSTNANWTIVVGTQMSINTLHSFKSVNYEWVCCYHIFIYLNYLTRFTCAPNNELAFIQRIADDFLSSKYVFWVKIEKKSHRMRLREVVKYFNIFEKHLFLL